MGVLNITPDSFSDGGQYFSQESAFHRATQIIEEGADIIDVGGESSRPGAEPISESEELRRVMPIVEKIASRFPVPISIDTYKASVAKSCIEIGASIINDISAMQFDPKMIKVVEDSGAFVILMHMKGNPKNMQDLPVYKDVISEIITFFKNRINEFFDLELVGDVRHKGMLVGIELVDDKIKKNPIKTRRSINKTVFDEGIKHNIFFRTLGNILMLVPPLSISEKELNFLIDGTIKLLRELQN